MYLNIINSPMIIRTILRISLSVCAVSVKAFSALAIIYSFALTAVQKNSLGASATRMVSLSSIFSLIQNRNGRFNRGSSDISSDYHL